MFKGFCLTKLTVMVSEGIHSLRQGCSDRPFLP